MVEATLNEGHYDCDDVGQTSVECREEDEVLTDGRRVSVPDGGCSRDEGCKPCRIDQSRYPIESMTGASHQAITAMAGRDWVRVGDGVEGLEARNVVMVLVVVVVVAMNEVSRREEGVNRKEWGRDCEGLE